MDRLVSAAATTWQGPVIQLWIIREPITCTYTLSTKTTGSTCSKPKKSRKITYADSVYSQKPRHRRIIAKAICVNKWKRRTARRTTKTSNG